MMDSDVDFDYVMSLPTYQPGSKSKEPVVFVFGWAGCQDRYLEKYTQVYSSLGYTLPTSITFWSTSQLPKIGEKIYETVYELELQEHPLVFHLLSGNGCFVFNAFRQHVLQAKDNVLSFAGMVFDSCPSAPSYYQRALAYTEITFPVISYPLLKNGVTFLCAVIFYVYDMLEIVRTKLATTSAVVPYRRYNHHFTETDAALNCPNLFLFSDADEIVSCRIIEEFIDVQRLKDIDVTAVRWTDSPHCGHLKVHGEQYREAVRRFIEKITGKLALYSSQSSEVDDFEKVDAEIPAQL